MECLEFNRVLQCCCFDSPEVPHKQLSRSVAKEVKQTALLGTAARDVSLILLSEAVLQNVQLVHTMYTLIKGISLK